MFLQKQNRIVGKFWNTSIIPANKRNYYEFTQVHVTIWLSMSGASAFSFRTKKGGIGED